MIGSGNSVETRLGRLKCIAKARFREPEDWRELLVEFAVFQILLTVGAAYANYLQLWEIPIGGWPMADHWLSFGFGDLVPAVVFGVVAAPLVVLFRRVNLGRLERIRWPFDMLALWAFVGLIVPTLVVAAVALSDPTETLRSIATAVQEQGAEAVLSQFGQLYAYVLLATLLPVLSVDLGRRIIDGRLRLRSRETGVIVAVGLLLLVGPAGAAAYVPGLSEDTDEWESDYSTYATSNDSAYDDGHGGPFYDFDDENVTIGYQQDADATLQKPTEDPPDRMVETDAETQRSPEGFTIKPLVADTPDGSRTVSGHYFLTSTESDIAGGYLLQTNFYAGEADAPSYASTAQELGDVVVLENYASTHVVVDVLQRDGNVHRYIFRIERTGSTAEEVST